MKTTTLLSALIAAIGMPLSVNAADMIKVTVTGTMDNVIFSGSTDGLFADMSPLYGKFYAAEFLLDPSTTIYTSTANPDVPGATENHWQYNLASVDFKVDGTTLYSHSEPTWQGLYTMNDATVPAGMNMDRIGVKEGNTYDVLNVDVSNIYLGCSSGNCGNQTGVVQGLSIGLEAIWNTAYLNVLADNSMPNLLAPGFAATLLSHPGPSDVAGAIDVQLNFWTYDQSTNMSNDVAALLGNVSTVTIVAVPVPESETYAMMLAGLGLLGMVARRKAV